MTIGDAIKQAWQSQRVEVIAGVVDGMRFQHGMNYDQIHATFCRVLDKNISLPRWDEIMRLADEGFSGTMRELDKTARL